MRWIELLFQKNGTLIERSGTLGQPAERKVGIFWDVKEVASGFSLKISGADASKVLLRKAGTRWTGRWIKNNQSGKTRMLRLAEVYPHLTGESPSKQMSLREMEEVRRSIGDEIHLVQQSKGIGDHVTSVYVCTGLARAGVRVTFHTHRWKWLSRVQETGLTISYEQPKNACRDLDYDYPHQLRYGISRALWFAAGLHPLLKPVSPCVDRTQKKRRLPFQRYILLAPFACWPAREWLDAHWRRLAMLLRNSGFEIVVIGDKKDASRMQAIFRDTQAYWVVNHPPEWVMDAMLGAAAFVGIDSGMTHVAALLRIKAIAIHAQLPSAFLWPKGTIESITPSSRCAFCRFQEDQGWFKSCEQTCSAMASVSPEAVLDAVLKVARSSAIEIRNSQPIGYALNENHNNSLILPPNQNRTQ